MISLTGYKTYIFALAGILVSGAVAMGYLDPIIGNTILGALGFGAVASLRSAIR